MATLKDPSTSSRMYINPSTIMLTAHSMCTIGRRPFHISEVQTVLSCCHLKPLLALLKCPFYSLSCPASVHCLRPERIVPPQQWCHVKETYMSISYIQSECTWMRTGRLYFLCLFFFCLFCFFADSVFIYFFYGLSLFTKRIVTVIKMSPISHSVSFHSTGLLNHLAP